MALSRTVCDFLADLALRGIKLVAQGDEIGMVAMAGRDLTRHDRLFISYWRQELLAALSADPKDFAIAMARIIFDAVPIGDEQGTSMEADDVFADGLTTCEWCGAEHNLELHRCWRCFPSVLDEVLGPAPRVPQRSVEAMVEEIVQMDDEERAHLRLELANAPDNDPVHTFEELALERAERVIDARKAGEQEGAA